MCFITRRDYRFRLNPTLKLYGDPDAEPGAFQSQTVQAAREGRDAEIDKVTANFEKVIDRLEDRRQRKERELSAEKKELADRKREQLFTTGEAFFSLLKRAHDLHPVAHQPGTAVYTRQTQEDLRESKDVISELDQEMDELEQQVQQALQQVKREVGARSPMTIRNTWSRPTRRIFTSNSSGSAGFPSGTCKSTASNCCSLPSSTIAPLDLRWRISLSIKGGLMPSGTILTIERHILEQQRDHPHASGAFTGLLYDIALAAKLIARETTRAGSGRYSGRDRGRECVWRTAAKARHLLPTKLSSR